MGPHLDEGAPGSTATPRLAADVTLAPNSFATRSCRSPRPRGPHLHWPWRGQRPRRWLPHPWSPYPPTTLPLRRAVAGLRIPVGPPPAWPACPCCSSGARRACNPAYSLHGQRGVFPSGESSRGHLVSLPASPVRYPRRLVVPTGAGSGPMGADPLALAVRSHWDPLWGRQ